MEAAKDAHAICVLTEWDEFKSYDYQKVRHHWACAWTGAGPGARGGLRSITLCFAILLSPGLPSPGLRTAGLPLGPNISLPGSLAGCRCTTAW